MLVFRSALEQQSIQLYHHAGIHVIETAARVVFAAVLGSIPVPVPGTRYLVRFVGTSTNCRSNTYEYQIRGILLSPTWYIRLQHWYTSTIDARYDTAVGNRAYAAKYRTMSREP